MATVIVSETVDRVARRDRGRSEAQLQAEIYTLLTVGNLHLGAGDVAKLEVPTQDGTRRRLDIEVGRCCIEVKKDLRTGTVLADARQQLAGYVLTQANQSGGRYVGIITDGATWHLHHLVDGQLHQVVQYQASPGDPDGLMTWLESVLATEDQIQPTPKEIRERLGADSPAHRLDHATLAALYVAAQDWPAVALKRSLWAKLLRTAFGSAFTDSSRLFIDHTLLVLTAEAIAHGVVGFDLRSGQLSPQDIARGTKFHDAQIYGVVEEDFFDWVLDVPGGPEFVLDLARRMGRFDWSGPILHDVLKALYTSVLPTADRQALGEYYTPDWLAERMVTQAYSDPLTQRLLEPACGSGTFLLHAVTHHLTAAEAAGMTAGQAVASATRYVIGMDVHPVSVILARVTYLMAIGRDRLVASDRGPLTVPVYLGDSVQWEQRTDLVSDQATITISTAGDDLVSGGGALFGDDLVFPASVLGNAFAFDQLVSTMADKARAAGKRPSREVIKPTLTRFGIHADDQDALVTTFDTMRRLHHSGRDHIWGYYVRNLIRPLWLADPANRVDVLVSNVPWLRYSKMTAAMQIRYRALSKERNLLTGALGASGRDLATLFVVRTVELYLKPGGAFSFVMPHGTLSRKPHTGFRTGHWGSKTMVLDVHLTQPWDLAKVTTGFPMTSCVVHGTLASAGSSAKALPTQALIFTGRLGNPDVTWSVASQNVIETVGNVKAIDAGVAAPASAYRQRFRQGAILVPRYLLFVHEQPEANPLGAGAGRIHVASSRSTQENPPWKDMPSLSGTVERRFVRDTLLGESIAPFRVLPPRRAVIPINDKSILTPSDIAVNPGLSQWWDQVERAWEQGRKPSEQLPLLERFDYHEQLSSQLPAAAHRVVYSSSGNKIAAAHVDNPRAVVEHKLYWAAVSSAEEARYLVAILNSNTLLQRVTPLQTQGLFGARDFDKYVFYVPIPTYAHNDPRHGQLVELARNAEDIAATVAASARFQATRAAITAALTAAGITQAIDQVVDELLDPSPGHTGAGRLGPPASSKGHRGQPLLGDATPTPAAASLGRRDGDHADHQSHI